MYQILRPETLDSGDSSNTILNGDIYHLDLTDDSYVCFIDQKLVFISLNQTSWKCYRCDLNFKEQQIANLHKSISEHPVRQIDGI